MNAWNRLLVSLDHTMGFPNQLSSTVRKRRQGFDEKTGEHVFWLEYRVKVSPNVREAAKPRRRLFDVLINPGSVNSG